MSRLLMDGLDSYIERHLPEYPDVIHEMEAFASERGFPIVGPQVGQFLKLLAETVSARRVFELGSGFGYSAVWFALGMPDAGQIVLTDFKQSNLDLAKGFLGRLWLHGMAEFHAGDALDHFRRARGEWDIVFSDIDKEAYPEVIELACRKLRLGGWFITDNALWGGEVLQPVKEQHESTKGVIEFNRRLAQHPGFENTILPIRDGVAIARKIGV